MIWIGTSGWDYEDWSGTIYPPDLPERDWLAHYAREFPTVEINRSFYRLPTQEQFQGWAQQTPPEFCFAVKASRFLTHMKKLHEPGEPLQRLTDAANGLGDRLGPFLYQLPPRWHANTERLSRFVALLGKQQAAFEFRDPSWHTAEVYDILAGAGCALAIGVRGRDPSPDDIPTVGPFGYLRFHHGGHGTGFADDELRPWANHVAHSADEGRDVFVYFNNDPEGHAITDARRLRDMLRDAGTEIASAA